MGMRQPEVKRTSRDDSNLEQECHAQRGALAVSKGFFITTLRGQRLKLASAFTCQHWGGRYKPRRRKTPPWAGFVDFNYGWI